MEDIIDLNSPKSLGEIVLPNAHPSSKGLDIHIQLYKKYFYVNFVLQLLCVSVCVCVHVDRITRYIICCCFFLRTNISTVWNN